MLAAKVYEVLLLSWMTYSKPLGSIEPFGPAEAVITYWLPASVVKLVVGVAQAAPKLLLA